MSGPEGERKKKELVKIFKDNGLSFTAKTNLKIADFLDIRFDLVKDIYQPYKKPNDDPLCINKKSNHPALLRKCLEKERIKRLPKINSDAK